MTTAAPQSIEQARAALKTHFGYPAFRGAQEGAGATAAERLDDTSGVPSG